MRMDMEYWKLEIALFVMLFLGFWMLTYLVVSLRMAKKFYLHTKKRVEGLTRVRLLERREKLLQIQSKYGFWFWMEQQLDYTGLRRHLPKITAEWIVYGVVLFAIIVMLTFILVKQVIWGVVILAMTGMGIWLGKTLLCMKENRRVNDSLMKLLDFLGNYSVTNGEIAGVLLQVSKHMEEPLKSVLENCYVEAQTTGDTSLALLSMADKIEHPKFKELIRNLEISCRYSADLSLLVNSSRRSMREYLRVGRERSGMIREAAINMLLLFLLSVVSLVTVNRLLTTSIWEVLLYTSIGKLAIGVVGFIFFRFLLKIMAMK